MADLEARPSTKLLMPYYVIAALFVIAIVWLAWAKENNQLYFLLILPAVLLLYTGLRHLRLRFTRMTIAAGRLRYELGVLSKSTRTIEVHKVQDVRVDQSLLQRMLNIGNISIETAGETSRLVMTNIDRPHAVADHILEAARIAP